MIYPYMFVYDFEVFAHDWFVVFKEKGTDNYIKLHNDYESVQNLISTEPMLVGFNNKHYDQFILKAVLMGMSPEEIKAVNDIIILQGVEGWNIQELKECRIRVNQYDLMDDCQQGLSLKAIEAHLGMDIRETTVSFDIDRILTPEECEEVLYYCTHDVDATDKLDDLRKDYLENKIKLGEEAGIPPERALSMTNAKLTAEFLQAVPPQKPWDDEREYVIPANLKTEYIPQEVLEFFNRIHDKSIPDDVLFKESMKINVGGCECKIAYGGIHGAIPNYIEECE